MATPSTTSVTAALTRLETVFSNAVTARQAIITDFAAVPADAANNARQFVRLSDLATSVKTVAQAAAASVDTAFADLSSAAADHAAAVRQADAQTPQYQAYLAELQANGALIGFLTEGDARAKLITALDNGLYPKARALAELIAARFPWGQRDTQTSVLLRRAADEIPDPDRDEADQFVADTQTALRNWSAARAFLDQRLSDVLDGGTSRVVDDRAGYYSPAFIMGQ